MAVHNLPARFDEADWRSLCAWKERYEAKVAHPVSWPDLLLAYANSKVLP